MYNNCLNLILNKLEQECKTKEHKCNYLILKDLITFKYIQINELGNLYITKEELDWEDKKVKLYKNREYNWIVWILKKNNILREINKNVYMFNPAFLIEQNSEYLTAYTLGNIDSQIATNLKLVNLNWNCKFELIKQEENVKTLVEKEKQYIETLILDIKLSIKENEGKYKEIKTKQHKRNKKLSRLFYI